ncbi:MAG: hypothetical protein GXY77_00945 [Fibrobacter sp.]|nr:hypothetical protein [Fibrobacter sp.]
MNGRLSVCEGDEIAIDIEKRLNREIELVKRVHVHYHPAEIYVGSDRKIELIFLRNEK